MTCRVRSMWWLWLALAALAALGASAHAQPPRPVCARDDQTQRCVARGNSGNHHNFLVNDEQVTYQFIDGGYFALECPPGIPFDEPALPRFEPTLRVRDVQLYRCWPRAGSYAAALRALNVTALDPPGPRDDPNTPTYSIDLALSISRNFNASVLAEMPTLRNLSMTGINVTPADLALLPTGLERLTLYYTRTGRVPAAALARLPHLTELMVRDEEPVSVEVEAARNLTSLYVDSPATLVSLSLPDTLSSLELGHWAVQQPTPWRSAGGLARLVLWDAAAGPLSDGWLANCGRLRRLELVGASNLSLAAGALRGATALEMLHVWGSSLEALPEGLLDDAPALRVLRLPGNRLRSLPGKLFEKSKFLRELDLSSNRLEGAALETLSAVTSLSELRLGYNIALDACPRARGAEHEDVQGWSPLHNLQNLTELNLAGTNTTRVCADWRRLPRLQALDLSRTPITKLDNIDLQFDTTVDMTVVLPEVDLSISREDYERFAAAAGPTLTLDLGGPLRCDCELYWVAAALRLPNTRLRATGGTSCQRGRLLNDVPLDELVCGAPGACPAGCACGTREDAASGRVLRLDCTGAGLRRVPRVETGAEPVALDLRLAGNHIDRLDPEDLTPELSLLDLRNNSLSVIDAAAAAALVSRADRRVLLAGNPLDCGCRAAAALSAMRAHPAVFQDWDDAACVDGTPLTRVTSSPCEDGGGARGPGNVTESAPNNVMESVLTKTTDKI